MEQKLTKDQRRAIAKRADPTAFVNSLRATLGMKPLQASVPVKRQPRKEFETSDGYDKEVVWWDAWCTQEIKLPSERRDH